MGLYMKELDRRQGVAPGRSGVGSVQGGAQH